MCRHRQSEAAARQIADRLRSKRKPRAQRLRLLASAEMPLPVAWLMEPVALAASMAFMAFMMPVATPPNAIVAGCEGMRMPDTIHAGIWLDPIVTPVIAGAMWLAMRRGLGL